MPTLQTCDFNHPPPQLSTGLSAHSFPHDPTNFEAQLASVPTLQICDFNHPSEKPVEDLLSATQDLMNIDNLIRFPSDIDEALLELPLKNPVPNPADESSSCHSAPLPLAEVSIPILQEGIPTIQVASAPAQLGLIMPQSDELNNNKVPVSSPNLPAPVRKRGTAADSESVKAMKAQIRDEQRKKQQ